jgi:peptidyl-Lys metalloendopeptidase
MTRKALALKTLAGALLVLGMALAAPFTALAAARLESRIAIDTTSLTTADEVVVNVSLANAGRSTARILRWQTLAFGINDDLFEVTRNGERVAYLGRHVKRPAPQASDYISLAPGQRLLATVPLSSLYDFSKPGEYTVRYRVKTLDLRARSARELVVDLVSSDLLTLWLEGDDLSTLAEPSADDAAAPSPSFVTPQFIGCSTSRRNTIRGAITGAEGQAAGARSFLDSGQRGSRYTTWFGSYSSARYTKARTTIRAIDSALRTRTLRFDCSCTESWYAYVYSNDPYRIYLCNAFWSASGADKAGTLTHELSHFDVVGGTSDWEYGVEACQALARDWPDYAVDNADSIAYFGY